MCACVRSFVPECVNVYVFVSVCTRECVCVCARAGIGMSSSGFRRLASALRENNDLEYLNISGSNTLLSPHTSSFRLRSRV